MGRQHDLYLLYFKEVDGEVQVADGLDPSNFHVVDLHSTTVANPTSLLKRDSKSLEA